jgi:hypothetical protein
MASREENKFGIDFDSKTKEIWGWIRQLGESKKKE